MIMLYNSTSIIISARHLFGLKALMILWHL